jgi:hypothetical protein
MVDLLRFNPGGDSFPEPVSLRLVFEDEAQLRGKRQVSQAGANPDNILARFKDSLFFL